MDDENEDPYLEDLEKSLLEVPSFRSALEELEFGHVHEGLGLDEDNICLVCGLKDALRILLGINQWIVDRSNEVDPESGEPTDQGVETIVTSMTNSTEDLAMLAHLSSLCCGILSLIAARASGILLRTIREESNDEDGPE